MKPLVPDGFVQWAVPEYEDLGPAHLERDDLENYPHLNLPRKAADFFTHLQTGGFIRRCLSFQEGRNLIARGVLPLWFPYKHLCLWRSTAFDIAGNMCVPWIQNISKQTPIIYWWWLEYDLYQSHYTVLFDQNLLPNFSSPAL